MPHTPRTPLRRLAALVAGPGLAVALALTAVGSASPAATASTASAAAVPSYAASPAAEAGARSWTRWFTWRSATVQGCWNRSDGSTIYRFRVVNRGDQGLTARTQSTFNGDPLGPVGRTFVPRRSTKVVHLTSYSRNGASEQIRASLKRGTASSGQRVRRMGSFRHC